MMTATFQNMKKPDNITIDINIGIGKTITYPCLCGKITYFIKLLFCKQLIKMLLILQLKLNETIIRVQCAFYQFIIPYCFTGYTCSFEPVIFQVDVIIVVNTI